MSETNAAFLRGRAQVYRRMASTAKTPAAAEDFLRLAAAWDNEAAALEAQQAQQPAPSILRQPAPSAEMIALRRPAAPQPQVVSIGKEPLLKIA